jgi:signal peptide peptidase SppA
MGRAAAVYRAVAGDRRESDPIGRIPVENTIYPGDAEMYAAQFRQYLADPGKKAIALHIDSPGGAAYGMHELANEIYAARGHKPVFSHVTSMAASAGMYLAAAAEKVYIESPASIVGNLGVIAIHRDNSKLSEKLGITITEVYSGAKKRLLSPNAPLSAEGRAEMQKVTDHYYSLMLADVATFRGVAEAVAHPRFMDGQTFTGTEAVSVGLVDGIASKQEFDALLLAQTDRSEPAAQGGSMDLKPNAVAAETVRAVLQEFIVAAKSDPATAKAVREFFGNEGPKQDGEAPSPSIQETREAERRRIQSVLALAENHSRYKAEIEDMAFKGDSSPEAVAYSILQWDQKRTVEAAAKVNAAVVAPVPGAGDNGDPMAPAHADRNPYAIHEAAKKLMEKEPDMSLGQAIATLRDDAEKETA